MSLITLLLSVYFTIGPLPHASCTCVPRPDVPFAEGIATASLHDYHVSKTNLRYVADRQQLQVEMHLFVEDLEEAMRDVGAPLLDIGTEDEHPDSERYISAYLQKHFNIGWNGAELPLTIIGWELEDDMRGMWIYLAAEEVSPPREITVKNGILTEYYPDQKNIVKLFDGKERLGTLLMNRDNTNGRVLTKVP